MALYKGSIASEISGAIDGLVFARNRGGKYIRANAVPVNPATPYQEFTRNELAFLTDYWLSGLTPSQRFIWEEYAINVPIVNRLGDPQSITPINHYIRCNIPRAQAGLDRLDDSPYIFNLGFFSSFTPSVDAAADEVSLPFVDTDPWLDDDGAAMLVYASRPQNETINFFKGPYRFAGSIEGDSMTPPTSPATVALPFPVEAGHKVFLKIEVTQADGRLSAPFRGVATAA